MATYTDPGLMNKIIDVWDQPTTPNPDGSKPAPVLFVAGINAQISGVDTNTESAALKTIFGDFMFGDEPLVNKITHKIVTHYFAGIKPTMFILYNDPDNGVRRFNINRIVDKDEQKVQLNILAIEWADQQFDQLLNTTADILTCDTSVGDVSGLSDPSFTTVATAVPCRVSMNTTVGRGRENWAKNKAAVAYREVLMRPWFADPAPDGSNEPFWVVDGNTFNTQPLTHDHWLQIPSASALNANNQARTGEKYDIIEIDNPGMSNHHLEVRCLLVIT